MAKSGALRIAREGLTMRPLADARLRMKTQLISRADNSSPAISELFRTFMRRLKQMRVDSQMSLLFRRNERAISEICCASTIFTFTAPEASHFWQVTIPVAMIFASMLSIRIVCPQA